MSFSLIILAAGNSQRFRSKIGKPYQKIGGKSLIEININKARKFREIKKIILVYNKKDVNQVKSLKLKNVKLVSGGKTRQQSTFNALRYLISQKGISKSVHNAVPCNIDETNGKNSWCIIQTRRNCSSST